MTTEKTKTPREMADLHVQAIEAEQIERFRIGESYYLCPEDTRRDYLAGLEAGARMGYEARHRLGYGPDSKVNWDSFNEWWASLEGEK